MFELWGQLCDAICRPPRDNEYSTSDLIGGDSGNFKIIGTNFEGRRDDLTLVNKKGQKLQCSHFFPVGAKGKDGRLPCVIYCHCNSGSRRDAEEAVFILIPLGVSVFTLDFAGSGLSEGQYVTLGCKEVDDVEVVVAHLRSSGKVSTLGLWGRSMGAVTTLLYSNRDPSIAGIVVDSPFARLTELMIEVVEEQKLPIPRALIKMVLAAMKRSIKKKAGFDIEKVAPVDVVGSSFIPALFAHATEDHFIRISHSEKIHAAYAGDKNLIRFEGDHNSRRPKFFYSSISVFFHNTLQLDTQLVGGNVLHQKLVRSLGGEESVASLPAVEAVSQSSSSGGGRFAKTTLDTWGAQARAGLTLPRQGSQGRQGSGSEPTIQPEREGLILPHEDSLDLDADPELVAAIQLSLLEAAMYQDGIEEASHLADNCDGEQASEQRPAFHRQRQTVSDSGSLAAGTSAPQSVSRGGGSSSGHGNGDSLPSSLPVPTGLPELPSFMGARSNRGSIRLPPPDNGRDSAPLGHSHPNDADEEEAMLREAIRLSLGQATSELKKEDGQTFLTDSYPSNNEGSS